MTLNRIGAPLLGVFVTMGLAVGVGCSSGSSAVATPDGGASSEEGGPAPTPTSTTPTEDAGGPTTLPKGGLFVVEISFGKTGYYKYNIVETQFLPAGCYRMEGTCYVNDRDDARCLSQTSFPHAGRITIKTGTSTTALIPETDGSYKRKTDLDFASPVFSIEATGDAIPAFSVDGLLANDDADVTVTKPIAGSTLSRKNPLVFEWSMYGGMPSTHLVITPPSVDYSDQIKIECDLPSSSAAKTHSLPASLFAKVPKSLNATSLDAYPGDVKVQKVGDYTVLVRTESTTLTGFRTFYLTDQ